MRDLRSNSERDRYISTQAVGKFFDDYADVWDEFYEPQRHEGKAFDYLNRQKLALQLIEKHLPQGRNSPGNRLRGWAYSP